MPTRAIFLGKNVEEKKQWPDDALSIFFSFQNGIILDFLRF
jgi:hypothetical protein